MTGQEILKLSNETRDVAHAIVDLGGLDLPEFDVVDWHADIQRVIGELRERLIQEDLKAREERYEED